MVPLFVMGINQAVFMIYAVQFSEVVFQEFSRSILFGLGMDFVVLEPLMILAIVAMPFLMENECFSSTRQLMM